ncbi:MAG: dTDP-4-amino-4,6-dideoxygalactose transaminase [Candidatus Hydrogenedentes bacterium]|nr:dTDP-4-amino-4,6-dideoxygalactose transaminase [Candidatus Hydrogenedentota bacterium]
MSLIPFNQASPVGNELGYIEEVLASGHIMGNGPYTRRCEALLESVTLSKRALLTTSCTSALEISALLLNLQPGDEIIVPSFAFVSTANAFVLHGATPVFADIRADTLNLDETQLKKYITSRTRAVIPLHYAGVACAMDAISEIAKRNNLVVIEDNAHGLSGAFQHKPLGSWGQMAALSFHETKNYTCGEGGALLINDEHYIERAEIIREKGTNRQAFFRGEVDKYSWVDFGSSYVLSDILAAMLLAQLDRFQAVYEKRREIWRRYRDSLQSWADAQSVRIPVVPPNCQQACHIFYLILPSENCRDRFIAHMRERDIHTVFHYLPLHLSRMGRRWGGKEGDCPVTEDISTRLVRLPFYYGLADVQQEEIITKIRAFTC